jgi:hypothetical protein
VVLYASAHKPPPRKNRWYLPVHSPPTLNHHDDMFKLCPVKCEVSTSFQDGMSLGLCDTVMGRWTVTNWCLCILNVAFCLALDVSKQLYIHKSFTSVLKLL